MESFGQFLKRERESRGVSQEDLAHVTRYHISKIEALEKDQYELLPAIPYVKGMIRSIAKYLELDIHEAISRYEEFLKTQVVEDTTPKVQRVKIQALPFYQQKQFLVTTATLSFVLLVILVSLFFKESKKITSLGEIVPSSSSQAKTETTAPVSSVPGEQSQTITLKPAQIIWAKTQIDSESPQQLSMKGGESVDLIGKKTVRFFVSNAKGLSIIFNGKEFSHSLQGPQTFVFPPTSKSTEEE